MAESSMETIFLYSGQGSQYYSMGKELYETNETFRKWLHQLNDVVRERTNEDIVRLLYKSNKKFTDNFDDVVLSSCAIFMVEYALTKALEEEGLVPDYVCGASLGEYVAATVAGVFSPEEALRIIIFFTQKVKEQCKPGTMTAIFTSEETFRASSFMNENSCLASVNFSGHIVVSGDPESISTIEKECKARSIVTQVLPVSYAFHSPLIDEIKDNYFSYIEKLPLGKPAIPFISCLDAKQIDSVNGVYFWNVIREPIAFKKTTEYIASRGDYTFIDAGPSGTLVNFVKYNMPKETSSKHFYILSPFGNENRNVKRIFESIKGASRDGIAAGSGTNSKIKKNNGMGDKSMRAYLFPGQGAQKVGMGEGLFEKYSDLVQKADAILGYSIKDLCLFDKENKLNLTQYTQPALFVVNALSYLDKREAGEKPDYVAGHSLGEYNALFAAGAFDFETGVRLVKKRGELIGQAEGGGMAAVVGLKPADIDGILTKNNLGSIDVANLNTPLQTVISGPKEEIENAAELFKSAGAKMYAPLKVSGAFHSRYMNDAAAEFKKFLDTVTFNELQVPVIANVTARPYEPVEAAIKENLAMQINNSVRWIDSIFYLKNQEVNDFQEVGEGKVLKQMNSRIDREIKSESIDISTDMSKPVMRPVPDGEKKNEMSSLSSSKRIAPEQLGSDEFCADYRCKYSYYAGAMYKGIASKEMVIALGKAGFLSFLGTGGMPLDEIESNIKIIQQELGAHAPYGMNLLSNPIDPSAEMAAVELYLKYNVPVVEAAAYIEISPALALYRIKGLMKENGRVIANNKVIAKVSRPEIAEGFLSPVNQKIIDKLRGDGRITKEEAELAGTIAVADDLCVEADSGGHTDQGSAYALLPAMQVLCDTLMKKYNYAKPIRVGAAGGIGTPQAACAAFILGADFVVTGSINQCTVEAGTSDLVKEMLSQMNVQDTAYAPAGDLFEMGAKVQVLRKGVFFPARANKLYDLYNRYNSLDELDEKTKKQLEEKYFKRTFQEIYEDCKAYYPQGEIDRVEKNPKAKMAMIFKWYFAYSTNLALQGVKQNRVDFQVHSGPALGAFNQMVKGTDLEDWNKRHVADIAMLIMNETAHLLEKGMRQYF